MPADGARPRLPLLATAPLQEPEAAQLTGRPQPSVPTDQFSVEDWPSTMLVGLRLIEIPGGEQMAVPLEVTVSDAVALAEPPEPLQLSV